MTKKDTVKVIELFAGIGSQTKGLSKAGIPHQVVGISEIDKYAIKSYNAIHGETHNFGDIQKIPVLPYADLWTYSFPCTDISMIGKREGFGKDSGTRSGLLWEVERLLMASEKPRVILLENVKNLVGNKFIEGYQEWIQRLDHLGYNTYWKVINSKNHGIPQNRERVFAISIRKDIDGGYTFPTSRELITTIDHIIEYPMDKKYDWTMDKAKKYIEKSKFYNTEVGILTTHYSVWSGVR